MSLFRTLSSSQYSNDNDDTREEYSHNGVSFAPLPPITAITTSQPYQMQHTQQATTPFPYMPAPRSITTEQLLSQTSQTSQTQPLVSGQLGPITGPIHDIPTTQSLISALQPERTTSSLLNKRVVVIPGTKKAAQQPVTEALPTTSRRMHPHLKHSIVLATVCSVLITTLLSLAPLDNGQNTFHVFGGVVQWVQAQQEAWNIQAHMQQATTQSPSAPVVQPVIPAPPPLTLPKSQYIAIAQQDAIDAGISPDYFVRQINQESGFNPNAYSPAGAVGIAQFLPSTAAGLGVNPYDPISALRGAARLMASYANQYGGDYAKALAAYNAGGGNVNYAINACGAANWMNCLPPETRNYIRVIMGI